MLQAPHDGNTATVDKRSCVAGRGAGLLLLAIVPQILPAFHAK